MMPPAGQWWGLQLSIKNKKSELGSHYQLKELHISQEMFYILEKYYRVYEWEAPVGEKYPSDFNFTWKALNKYLGLHQAGLNTRWWFGNLGAQGCLFMEVVRSYSWLGRWQLLPVVLWPCHARVSCAVQVPISKLHSWPNAPFYSFLICAKPSLAFPRVSSNHREVPGGKCN